MKPRVLIAIAVMLIVPTQIMAQRERTARPDWITATNQPCKIWNPQPEPNESVTWSGMCKDGLASGQGTLHWMVNGKPDVDFEGTYANGKRNGHGVIILPDGKRIEGQWVNDELLTGDANPI